MPDRRLTVAHHKRSVRYGDAKPAKEIFVSARVAQSILQINANYLSRLKREGKIKGSGNRDEYNLADVLERYQAQLRTQGLLVQETEARCIREFEAGKLPVDVIIEHGFSYEVVKAAWDHFMTMKKDPDIARIEAEREASTKKQEVTRCGECVRTSIVALEDTHRVVREATGDPKRTSFNFDEERMLVGLNIRCSSCRMLKATAPIESIRARLRLLAVTGLPKPIDVDRDMPLPSASPTPNTEKK